MKSFEELTINQRWAAIDHAASEIVEGIYEGVIEITIENPYVQKRLELHLKHAREANSKRLFQLNVLHEKPIRMEISKLAMAAAAGSKYRANGKPVLVTKNEISKYLDE